MRVTGGRVAYDEAGNRVAVLSDGRVMATGDEIINNYVTPALPDSPVPIRTPAQVMRIWVAPYVDTTGDLIAPGFVYTEVESRRWIYPDDQAQHTGGRSFSPLKVAPKQYSTPNSYSNPSRVKASDQKDGGFNSLLKYRRDRAAEAAEMRAAGIGR